jgi:hypothetical protein
LQGEQAPLLQLSDGQLAVCEAGFMLQTEAANPHANPLIKSSKRPEDLCDTEVVGKSSNDRVEVIDDRIDIPPLLSTSHKADTVFELFKGALSNFNPTSTVF